VLNGLLAAVPPIAGGGWGPGPHPGFWWIWPLAWLLFLAALATVLALVAWRRPARRSWSSAEAVLAERFARGEITEDEYRRALEVLRERR